jgi:transcriptional regulator of NAD metabolism
MTAKERREQIKQILLDASAPLSASKIAQNFSVTRQIIVGDIALLRATGCEIYATPRGYIYEKEEPAFAGCEKTIACQHHTLKEMQEELYTIVDNGAQVMNVTVEHSLYGQISAPLLLSSRYEVDAFIEKAAASDSRLLSDLTGGIHLHQIRCPDPNAAQRVEKALLEKGILFSKN